MSDKSDNLASENPRDMEDFGMLYIIYTSLMITIWYQVMTKASIETQ